MKLLGLCGYAGSGKDYVYGKLTDVYPRNVYRVALADPLRREIEDTLNYGNNLKALWSKPYPEEVRRLLQWWGTEYRRGQDPDYWTKQSAIEIESIGRLDPHSLIVVTDVRYGNEAEMIRALGGKVAEVHATAPIRVKRLGGPLPPAHPSEEIDFKVDYFVYNNHETVVPADMLVHLGLFPTCAKCRRLETHPWHDNGYPNE